VSIIEKPVAVNGPPKPNGRHSTVIVPRLRESCVPWSLASFASDETMLRPRSAVVQIEGPLTFMGAG